MQTFTGQFYANEKAIALDSQILFPADYLIRRKFGMDLIWCRVKMKFLAWI